MECALPEYLNELAELSSQEVATGRARQPGSVWAQRSRASTYWKWAGVCTHATRRERAIALLFTTPGILFKGTVSRETRFSSFGVMTLRWHLQRWINRRGSMTPAVKAASNSAISENSKSAQLVEKGPHTVWSTIFWHCPYKIVVLHYSIDNYVYSLSAEQKRWDITYHKTVVLMKIRRKKNRLSFLHYILLKI